MHKLLRNLKFLRKEEENHENIAGCLCAGDFAAGRVNQPSFWVFTACICEYTCHSAGSSSRQLLRLPGQLDDCKRLWGGLFWGRNWFSGCWRDQGSVFRLLLAFPTTAHPNVFTFLYILLPGPPLCLPFLASLFWGFVPVLLLLFIYLLSPLNVGDSTSQRLCTEYPGL